jgi:transcriptional regulator with XRE-family HTH domain
VHGYASIGRPQFAADPKEQKYYAGKLAEISGFSQQYISGLEQGQRNPTVVTVYELSIALGVNYIELLKADSQAKRERE